VALEFFWAALACFLGSTAVALAAVRFAMARALASATSMVGNGLLIACAAIWLSGQTGAMALPSGTPLGAFSFRAAPLPGLFLLVLGLVGLGISIYSVAYVEHTGGRPRQASVLALLSASQASMAALLASADAFTLLTFWELTSVFTYVLVTVQFDHPGRPRAAFMMLALSELGLVAMAAGFALIGGFNTHASFATLAARPPVGPRAGVAFVLFLFGFGAKAGLLPLQGWLPEAHPAAPANVSALLSAVVVKMSIFGLALTGISILGTPAAWWGFLALALGVVTAFYGVLFSLLASDLKRALAYSTVENLGFMIAILGAALIFRSAGKPALEATALVAMLLHALYHALVKGALFLGAGNVDVATGIRDMDRLGGLARTMRWSTLLFFVATMGIAGIPPLNSFQTEWLGLQVLIRAHDLTNPASRVLLGAAGALLTLTLALAMTTYIRVFGGTFLGAAPSRAARSAAEVAATMRAGMAVLLAAAVAMALVPPIGIGAAAAAAQDASGVSGMLNLVLPPIFLHPGAFATPVRLGATFLDRVLPGNGLVIVPASIDHAFIAPTYLFLALLFVIGLVALGLWVFGIKAARHSEVWAGSVPYEPAMQYTATAFTNPMRFIFGSIYRSRREVEGDYYQAPFFARTISYSHRFVEPIETYLYRPLVRCARRVSEAGSLAQSGNISVYLLYLFTVFLVVLFIR
jgi:hydrogenase-4 component B